jgi:hypothetical protein
VEVVVEVMEKVALDVAAAAMGRESLTKTMAKLCKNPTLIDEFKMASNFNVPRNVPVGTRK